MKLLIRYSELAYVRAIPDLLHGELRQGRLKNLYDRLVKAVDEDLMKLPRLSDGDMLIVRDIIVDFGEKTGWVGKRRHVSTLLSFAIAIVEASEHPHNPRILETLTQIVEYHERKSQFKFICCDAGAVAARKWREINR